MHFRKASLLKIKSKFAGRVKMIQYLIDQCRHPTGIIGNIMINIWNRTFLQMALWGLSNVKIRDTDILLEIGCGGGKFINYLARQKSAGKIYGVDISKSAIRKAAALNKSFTKTDKVILSQEKADNRPFTENMFHKIFAIQTHMYWTKIEESMERIFTLLIVGGEFNIICEKDKIQYHLPKYQKKEIMIKMLEQSGFSRINVFETENWIQYQCIKSDI
jgi:ubiquinone/menaquinone biosynthesis C-methylase UbiE